jgi:hypothetical protein
MANMPPEFRSKIDRLERNFAVSMVIFKKYQPIFIDMFYNPVDDQPRQQRSRKQRLVSTSETVFYDDYLVVSEVSDNMLYEKCNPAFMLLFYFRKMVFLTSAFGDEPRGVNIHPKGGIRRVWQNNIQCSLSLKAEVQC